MPTPLRVRLNDLASMFAASVLGAIRGASLEELLTESSRGRAVRAPSGSAKAIAPGARRRNGRLPRRSAKDIAGVIHQIEALLKAHPKGLRAEQIRTQLGLQAKELPRPLKEGLDAGRFSKSGQKRATTYVVKGVAGSVRSAKRRAAGGKKRPRSGTVAAARKGPKQGKGEVEAAVVAESAAAPAS